MKIAEIINERPEMIPKKEARSILSHFALDINGSGGVRHRP